MDNIILNKKIGIYLIILLGCFIAVNQKKLHAQTKSEILAYLKSLPSQNKVIIGQQCGDGNNIENWAYPTFVLQLHKETGEYPGIMGADYGWKHTTDPLLVNNTLKKYASKGGLVELTWHAMNPWTLGNPRDNLINFNMNELITPDPTGDSTVYDNWIAELDKIALGLNDLKNDGIIVLWRPLHEMNGGWFWWGKKSQNGFINVWRHMHDYFTNQKGLDNLIWVYSISPEADYTKDALYYYPGGDYVDIVGEDIYDKESAPKGYEKLVAETGKPYALTEYGPNSSEGNSNLNVLNANRGKACYWLQWHTWDNGLPTAIIDNPHYMDVMNHEDVVTASEISIEGIENYDTASPTQPVLQYSDLTQSSVVLNWDIPQDDSGIYSYYLFRDGFYDQTITDTSIKVSGLISGNTYSFSLRALDSCGNFSPKSEPIQIIPLESSININNYWNGKIKLYPNPAHHQINIASVEGFPNAKIYDITGRIIESVQILPRTTAFDVSQLTPGIYCIEFTKEQKKKCMKFIIKK